MLKKDISTTDRMGWADLLWYDETVDARPIDELATFRHFEDTGWITTRSDWGSDAVMVGFKCGPPHGHAVQALYDRMKTFHQIVNGHGHPDVGQFDIFAYGRHLAVDDAYPKPKWTKNHNTIIVNGTGQLGEGSDWFDRDAVFVVKPASHIIKAENTARFDYIIGDAGNIYPKSAGLGKFYRHLVYVKPDLILVVDELQSCKSSGFEWRLHAGGPLRQMDSDYCIVENDGVNMDICFVHPTDITIGIKEKVLSGSFTGAGEQIMAVVMHPRKAADSPALIKSYSLVGGLLDVVIQYGNETKNIRLDVAGRKVTIF